MDGESTSDIRMIMPVLTLAICTVRRTARSAALMRATHYHLSSFHRASLPFFAAAPPSFRLRERRHQY